jgi:tetratricopeptide (TPR) repeat protein
MKNLFISLIIFSISSGSIAFSQEVDIIPFLKQVEKGEINSVREILPKLKIENPNSANLIFLEGVLTENGQDAVSIYQNFVEKYPDNSFADAALYRIYSYYYALGLYDTASKVLKNLSDKYPESPYIKLALSQEETKQAEDLQTSTPPKDDKQKTKKDANYKFTIQAGAFVKNENAQGLKTELEEEGIFCEIKEKNVGGTIFHVVYAGNFQDRKEAEAFLQQLNSRYNLNGRIIEKEK